MKKRIAACFLTAFFVSSLALSLPASAVDGVTRTYRNDEAFSDHVVGDLAVVTASERPIHVCIEKESQDGILPYYDETLSGAGTYHFILDCSEYDYEDDDPAAEYLSFYTVTINDVADSRSTFTMEDILVPDPGAPNTDASSAEYTLNVTLRERDARDARQTGESAVEDGVLRGSFDIDIDYLNYTLGDVDADNAISVGDARLCLLYYAAQASNTTWTFSSEVHTQSENDCLAAADTNLDDTIDVEDARRILVYYARQSVGETPSWDEIS